MPSAGVLRSALGLPRRRGPGVVEEEAHHLAASVGPLRIGVGTGRAAAEPSVTGPVHDPLLKERLSARVGMKRQAVGVPAGGAAVLRLDAQPVSDGGFCLGDDLIAVDRAHGAVLIAMEHDRRDSSLACLAGRAGPAYVP